MSNTKQIAKITNTQIQGLGVQALATRPNDAARYGEGGLSAEQLKRKFDRLPEFIIDKVNELIDILTSSGDKDVRDYIKIGLNDGINTLADFVCSITDGKLANAISLSLTLSPDEKKNLTDILDSFDSSITENASDISSLEQQAEQLATAMPRSLEATIDGDYKLTISIKNSKGEILGDSVLIDLPLESMIVNVEYNAEDNSLYLLLVNGTSVGPIPLEELVSGLVTSTDFDSEIKSLKTLLSKKASTAYVDEKIQETQLNLGGYDLIVTDLPALAKLPSAKGRVLVKDLAVTRADIATYNEKYTGNLLPYPYVSIDNEGRSFTDTAGAVKFSSGIGAGKVTTFVFADEEHPLTLSRGTYTFNEYHTGIDDWSYVGIGFRCTLYFNGDIVLEGDNISHTFTLTEKTVITDLRLVVALEEYQNLDETSPTIWTTVSPVLYEGTADNPVTFVPRLEDEVYPAIPTTFNLSCDTIEFSGCAIGDGTDTEDEHIEFNGQITTTLCGVSGDKSSDRTTFSKFYNVTNVYAYLVLAECVSVTNCSVHTMRGCWAVSNSNWVTDGGITNKCIDPMTCSCEENDNSGKIPLVPDYETSENTYLDPSSLASREYVDTVLEQFGTVSELIVSDTTNLVSVPTEGKVSEAAVINSFGGLTYKKGASGGGNLLPYPYASMTSGMTEVMGIITATDVVTPFVHYINEDNAITLEPGTYVFEASAFGGPAYLHFIANGVSGSDAVCSYTFVFTETTTITKLSCGRDDGEVASGICKPVLYRVEDYPDGFEFEPRCCDLVDTKVEEIRVRGKNQAQKVFGIKCSGASLKTTLLAEDAEGKHCGSLLPVIGGKTYTLSKTGATDAAAAFRYFWFDKEPVLGETMSIGGGYNPSSSTIVTTAPDTAKYLYVRWTEDDELYPCGDVQIEFGDTATEYVPYIEPTVITVPDVIKDIDGYGTGLEVCPNVVDLDNDRFDTRSKTIVLTGKESIVIYEYASARGIRIDNILDGIYGRQHGVCSHANVDEVGKIRAGDMWLGVLSERIFWLGILDILGFNSGDDDTDIASFKAWLTAQYDAGHPVTIVYKTDTPSSQPLPYGHGMDGLIDVEKGGSIEFVTDTGEAVPVSVEFQIINQAEVTASE